MGNLLVTRYPNGVGTTSEDDIFADLAMPDPTRFHTFFDDFDNYLASNWTVTETQAGATQALTNGDGGLLLLTNSAAENDLNALQKVGESFLLSPGRRAFFKARFQVSDATQCDFVMGLQVTDSTPLDVTDGIYFLKSDDSTSVSLVCRKNATTGSNTVSNVATIASATFITLAWCYDGQGGLKYAVDGVVRGSTSASTDFLPDTTLTVSFGIQNGDANARTMTVDYIFAAEER